NTSRLLTDVSVLLCATLALSPISWTHYYCLLLIPIAAIVTRRIEVPSSPSVRVALGTAIVLVSLPVMLWVPSRAPFNALVARVLFSHYLLGALLFLVTLLAGRISISLGWPIRHGGTATTSGAQLMRPRRPAL